VEVPELPNEKFFKTRYSDAYRIANGLVSTGQAIKFGSAIVAIAVTLFSFFLLSQEDTFTGIGVLFAGIVGGLTIYVSGIVIAALGQIFRALLDTAINTSPLVTPQLNALLLTQLNSTAGTPTT
jgi:hypothetical protein